MENHDFPSVSINQKNCNYITSKPPISFMEWYIHRCTSSGCGTPHHTTFPEQPVKEQHSSPFLSQSAASWSDPSWKSWLGGCWHQHTGLPSLCLPRRSRSPWFLGCFSLHSPSPHCSPSCPVVLQEFLLERYSFRLPHGNVWALHIENNTSCVPSRPGDTLKA